MKPRIVLSGVNLTEMGPLMVFQDALASLASEYADNYEIIALVHRTTLFNVPGVTFMEFPRIKSSWLRRVCFEYYDCRAISKKIKSHLWFAMHDMTPNVYADIRAVYCHNPSPFYAFSLGEAMLDWKFGVFVVLYRFLYRINIKSNDFVIVQQESLNIDFIVAGKGPLLLKYRQSVNDRKLRNIQLIGYVPDGELAARYRDCDCVLVTCENGEGFGLPVIEGYLFNKPVGASDKCAVPEVILEPKYLSKNEPEAMLQVLNSTLAEQVEDVRFLDHYTNHFANEVILKQFSELYEEAFD